MIIVPRDYIKDDYPQIYLNESHHNHKIVKDKNGKLRWESYPDALAIFNSGKLTDYIIALRKKDYDKNSEKYRHFYRSLGYSLDGYVNIFYQKLNNDLCDFYRPQPLTETDIDFHNIKY